VPTPDTTPVAISRAQPEKKGSVNKSSSNSFLVEFTISSLSYDFFKNSAGYLASSPCADNVLDPLDFPAVLTRQQHRIKPAWRCRFQGREIVAGGKYQFLLFVGSDARSGTAKKETFAHSDFDKHHYNVIPHNEIDFSEAAAIVSLEQRQTMLSQKCLRKSLRIDTRHVRIPVMAHVRISGITARKNAKISNWPNGLQCNGTSTEIRQLDRVEYAVSRVQGKAQLPGMAIPGSCDAAMCRKNRAIRPVANSPYG
jgi:hypothetical protein